MEKPTREELVRALDELFSCLASWQGTVTAAMAADYPIGEGAARRFEDAMEAAEDVLDRDSKGA